MKRSNIGILAIAVTLSLQLASAEEHRRPPEPRAKGVPQHGMEHHLNVGGKVVHSPVFHENRPVAEVRRDPHVVAFNHVGWHPVGHWDHWYRDWGVFWRISDWNVIRTVTCEAVDTRTEYLYPVSETRAENWYWNPTLVNNVAARALDECAAESGDPAACALVQGECWNSMY